jgi:hypothetical protein
MSTHALLPGLAIAATALDGLLAGASLDQSIKQLPARRRIGAIAYSVYARAADLGNGLLWYPLLGIGAALLTIVAAVMAFAQSAPSAVALPLYLAAVTSLAHSFTTSRAAPIMLSQRRVADDESALRAIFARFERWQTARAILQAATFALMLWALVAISAIGGR